MLLSSRTPFGSMRDGATTVGGASRLSRLSSGRSLRDLAIPRGSREE